MQACSPKLITATGRLERNEGHSLRRICLNSLNWRRHLGGLIAVYRHVLWRIVIWTLIYSLFHQCGRAWNFTRSMSLRVLNGAFAGKTSFQVWAYAAAPSINQLRIFQIHPFPNTFTLTSSLAYILILTLMIIMIWTRSIVSQNFFDSWLVKKTFS